MTRPDIDAIRAREQALSDLPERIKAILTDKVGRIDHCDDCHAENPPQEPDRCPECGHEGTLISTWGEAQAERYRTGERYDSASRLGNLDVDGDANPDLTVAIEDIAHARTDIPRLLAYVGELERENANQAEALHTLKNVLWVRNVVGTGAEVATLRARLTEITTAAAKVREAREHDRRLTEHLARTGGNPKGFDFRRVVPTDDAESALADTVLRLTDNEGGKP